MPAHQEAPKKYQRLSLESKIAIIREVQSGKSQLSVALQHKTTPSNVCQIISNKQAYLQKSETTTSTQAAKIVRVQHSYVPAIDQCLLLWFQGARSTKPALPVTPSILQAKAKEIAQELLKRIPQDNKLQKFEGSPHFVSKFMDRHNLVYKKEHGEAASVDISAVIKGKNELQHLLKDFTLDTVYNADELGLFYRTIPDKTIVYANDETRGIRKKKTVSLCFFAATRTARTKGNRCLLANIRCRDALKDAT
jgi:hypothetical protein